MNEGRCLEAVSGSFPRQFRGREAAQFVIDERKQFIGGLGVALLNAVKDACDIAHRAEIKQRTMIVELRKRILE